MISYLLAFLGPVAIFQGYIQNNIFWIMIGVIALVGMGIIEAIKKNNNKNH